MSCTMHLCTAGITCNQVGNGGAQVAHRHMTLAAQVGEQQQVFKSLMHSRLTERDSITIYGTDDFGCAVFTDFPVLCFNKTLEYMQKDRWFFSIGHIHKGTALQIHHPYVQLFQVTLIPKPFYLFCQPLITCFIAVKVIHETPIIDRY